GLIEAGGDPRCGDVFLSAEERGGRVSELGAQIAADYADRDLLLVALLKSSFIFLADLSRAIPSSHQLDFVQLAGYGTESPGGHSRVRLLQDVATALAGPDVPPGADG